jgi:hypothetical protein
LTFLFFFEFLFGFWNFLQGGTAVVLEKRRKNR